MMYIDKDLEPLMDTKAVAEYLGISRDSVYNYMRVAPKYGGLPYVKLGRCKMVRLETLKKWLEEGERGSFEVYGSIKYRPRV
jgi:excisionase family DNA binding protein